MEGGNVGSRADRREIESAVIRFAGDSGDGMQLTGSQFTQATAIARNDLATFPDFPAEIRAPVGTTFGVSAYQINFGARTIKTAGDELDVLVAMNPAALKTNLKDVKRGGLVIVDIGEFTDKNFRKVNLSTNPSKRSTPSVRIAKKRDMIRENASGSSASASSIEPFTSAKSTVTCLRSPSTAAFDWRILSARCLGVSRGVGVGAVALTLAPHSPQNNSPISLAAPHDAHLMAKRAPQPEQNFRPSRLSVLQDWHFICSGTQFFSQSRGLKRRAHGVEAFDGLV